MTLTPTEFAKNFIETHGLDAPYIILGMHTVDIREKKDGSALVKPYVVIVKGKTYYEQYPVICLNPEEAKRLAYATTPDVAFYIVVNE